MPITAHAIAKLLMLPTLEEPCQLIILQIRFRIILWLYGMIGIARKKRREFKDISPLLK